MTTHSTPACVRGHTKVFYLGLHRSGTLSFHLWAHANGLRSLHNARVTYRAIGLRRAADGSWAFNQTAVDEHLAAYDAFADLPWPLLYPALAKQLGSRATFILGARSSAAWWDSVSARYTYPGHPDTAPLRQMMYGGYGYPRAAD